MGRIKKCNRKKYNLIKGELDKDGNTVIGEALKINLNTENDNNIYNANFTVFLNFVQIIQLVSEEEDMSTLFLTLNLYLEKNNKESFYKPYIDLIYTNKDYFSTWTDDNLKELHNSYMAQSIKNFLNEIDQMHKLLIKCKAFS